MMTREDGSYVVPQLPAGKYDVAISRNGFKTTRARQILVEINQSVRYSVQLEVGEITTTVDVHSQAELTNTYTAQLSQTIDSRRVKDLPLNGRDVTSLSLLVAGATVDTSSVGFYSNGSGFAATAPIVNGNRNQSNNYLLDGVTNIYYQRLSSNLYPNPDAIEEFTVNTAQYAADMGGSPGAQLSARTKSGTNALHGSVFEFLRNGSLNARNAFDRSGKNDGLQRNQYGWAVGGPVYIPKVLDGRNKLFWFSSLQNTPFRRPGAPGFHESWTRREKDGDFSEHLTGLTRQVASPLCNGTMLTVDQKSIFDPRTANSSCGSLGFTFPGNIIPRDRLDPVMQSILNKHTPDSPRVGFQIPHFLPAQTDESQLVTKIDYNLGKHSIMGRHIYAENSGKTFNDAKDLLWGSDVNAFGILTFAKSVAVSDTWTVSPNLLVTGGFLYVTNPWSTIPHPNQTTWAEHGSKIIVDTSADPNSICREFIFSVAGRGGIRTYDKCGLRDNHSWDSNGAVKWVRSKHEFSFGGSFGRHFVGFIPRAQSGGSFSFGGQFTGISAADAVLGVAQTYGVTNFGVLEENERTAASLYLQDNFRVTRKLTLNLGARWEPGLPNRNLSGFSAWLIDGLKSQRFRNAPAGVVYFGDPGTPEGNFFPRWNQVSPRFGFAYDPSGNGKWAIRGGVGSYYGVLPGGNSLEPSARDFAPLPSGAITINNPVSLVNPWDTAPFNGRPGIPFPTPSADVAVPLPLGGWAYDPRTKLPNTWTWSLTLEREMGSNLLLRAGYVATRGTHLTSGENPNLPVYIPGASTIANAQQRRPNQALGGIHVTKGIGDSHYHGLQITAQKRYSGGLTFLTNYTFSKSIDTSSTDLGWSGAFGTQDPRGPGYNRGLSEFDHTHVFNNSVVWDLPTLSDKPLAARAVFGNWQISNIIQLTGGSPFTIVSSAGNSLSPGRVGGDRADLVAGENPILEGRDRQEQVNIGYFNQKAFRNPAIGTRGVVGRSTIRGPGIANVDFLLAKIIPIREGVNLQFRSEYFNLFNRVNLSNPNSDVNNPNFGKIFGARQARILQFALKLQF